MEGRTEEQLKLQGDYDIESYPSLDESDNVEVISLYDYILTKDGEIRWQSDRPMYLRRVSGNYLQDFYGDYNTVYDPDGNVVIRKLNNNRAQD